MRSDARGRVSQVEDLECRMVLSSHPLGDFRLDFLSDGGSGAGSPAESVTLYTDSATLNGLESVRQTYGFRGTGQTVAVIDSGIAWDHVALGQGWGPEYRVVGGWDFTGENDGDPYDDGPFGSHGTHVAGIIASDTVEQTGVAPGVDLVALRVFDDHGAGYFEWVEQALDWVHDHLQSFANPITTVNLSLGTTINADAVPDWAMLEDELAQLESEGVFVSVAAGNGFEQFQSPGLSYPASSPYVVPVMSADPTGQLSYFSQRHERAIAAPGRWISSSVPDYAGNQNGRPDDYATYSGTSMASPYVAGASVLLREAMDLVGYVDVDQEEIRDVMMDTAGSLTDAQTNRIYRQLDLAAAIDAVMPDDDYGSSPGEAWDMGVLTGDVSFDGFIGTLTDADYFSFTAGASGTVSLRVDASHHLDVAWHTPDGTLAVDDAGRMVLDVDQGQTYSFGISTRDGLGYYSLVAELSGIPEPTDLGVVDFVRMTRPHERNSGWYRIKSAREGLLTVDATSNGPSAIADIGLYDAQWNLLAASRPDSNHWRADVSTRGADVYYLRVTTHDADVDLRISNQLQITSEGVDVYGAPGDDVFHITCGAEFRLRLNQIEYRLPRSLGHSLRLHGAGGLDAVSVVAGAGANRGLIRSGRFELEGDGYIVEGDQFEQIRLYGRGEQNRVRMYGSAGSDDLVMTPGHVRLAGGGIYAFVEGFPTVRVYGMSGADNAFVSDSPNDDNYVAAATHVRMAGDGYYRFADGFEVTRAVASTGEDVAYLYDSVGDDTLEGDARHVQFNGPSFSNSVRGFDRVVAYAAQGWDEAVFYVLGGNGPRTASHNSPSTTDSGYVKYISGFDRTYVHGLETAQPGGASSDRARDASPEHDAHSDQAPRIDIVVSDVWAWGPQGLRAQTAGLNLLDHLFELLGRCR